jgi:hypothetical protein
LDSPASTSPSLVALSATPHAHAAEFITAILILGVGALVVAVATVVGRRLERRAIAAGSAAAGERRAGADERLAAHRAADAVYCRIEQRGAPLVVVDDAFTSSVAIEPWRPAPASDLGEVPGGRRLTSYAWSARESDELVARFRGGFALDEFAGEMGVFPCAVVEELARRAFGATEPVSDPGARRFGRPWTAAELRTLHSAWTAGLGLSDIARQLGRDQLSTAFRLLESAADARDAAAIDTATAGERPRVRSGVSLRG